MAESCVRNLAANEDTFESLSGVFKCFICMEKLNNARLCPHCSKLCCYDCITKWITENRPQCPHCRTTLHTYDLINCRWADEVTQQLDNLQCQNKTKRQSGSRSSAANVDICEIHNERLSVFCETCDRAICHQCALFDGKHGQHHFRPLDDVYREKVGVCKLEVERLKLRYSEITSLIQNVEKNVHSIKQAKDEKVCEIRNAVALMVARLESQLNKKLTTLMVQRNNLSQETELISSLQQEIRLQLFSASKSNLISSWPALLKTCSDIHKTSLTSFSQSPVSIDFQSEIVPPYDSSIFVISNFTTLRQRVDPVYSPPLNAGGLLWRLKVYPDGNGVVRGNYLSVFLELSNGVPEPSKYEYRVELIHQALRRDPTKNIVREFSSEFEVGECWGYNRFFRLDLLSSEGYLSSPSDTLALKFQIRAPNYYQKCRDLQWHISQMESNEVNVLAQLAEYKNSLEPNNQRGDICQNSSISEPGRLELCSATQLKKTNDFGHLLPNTNEYLGPSIPQDMTFNNSYGKSESPYPSGDFWCSYVNLTTSSTLRNNKNFISESSHVSPVDIPCNAPVVFSPFELKEVRSGETASRNNVSITGDEIIYDGSDNEADGNDDLIHSFIVTNEAAGDIENLELFSNQTSDDENDLPTDHSNASCKCSSIPQLPYMIDSDIGNAIHALNGKSLSYTSSEQIQRTNLSVPAVSTGQAAPSYGHQDSSINQFDSPLDLVILTTKVAAKNPTNSISLSRPHSVSSCRMRYFNDEYKHAETPTNCAVPSLSAMQPIRANLPPVRSATLIGLLSASSTSSTSISLASSLSLSLTATTPSLSFASAMQALDSSSEASRPVLSDAADDSDDENDEEMEIDTTLDHYDPLSSLLNSVSLQKSETENDLDYNRFDTECCVDSRSRAVRHCATDSAKHICQCDLSHNLTRSENDVDDTTMTGDRDVTEILSTPCSCRRPWSRPCLMGTGSFNMQGIQKLHRICSFPSSSNYCCDDSRQHISSRVYPSCSTRVATHRCVQSQHLLSSNNSDNVASRLPTFHNNCNKSIRPRMYSTLNQIDDDEHFPSIISPQPNYYRESQPIDADAPCEIANLSLSEAPILPEPADVSETQNDVSLSTLCKRLGRLHGEARALANSLALVQKPTPYSLSPGVNLNYSMLSHEENNVDATDPNSYSPLI